MEAHISDLTIDVNLEDGVRRRLQLSIQQMTLQQRTLDEGETELYATLHSSDTVDQATAGLLMVWIDH